MGAKAGGGADTHINGVSISGKGTSLLWKDRGKPERHNRKNREEGQMHPRVLKPLSTAQSLILTGCIPWLPSPLHRSIPWSSIEALKMQRLNATPSGLLGD